MYRLALRVALKAVYDAAQRRDLVTEVLAGNFSLLPLWLLRGPSGQGRVGKAELSERFELFSRGHWDSLDVGDQGHIPEQRSEGIKRADPRTKSSGGLQKVRLGEVSHARPLLIGGGLAPGSEETLRELQNKRRQIQLRELPPQGSRVGT